MNKVVICLVLCLAITAANPVSDYFENLLGLGAGKCSCKDIQSMVAENEGSRSCVYKDSLGIPTIGIGFNLQRGDAKSILSGLGLDYNKVLSGKQCLSQAQITSVFNHDLAWAKAGAAKCIPSFKSLPGCIQNVMIDMTFNMGASSLCSWTTLKNDLAAKKYAAAASFIKGTLYCRQVGNRCTRNTNIISSC